MSAFYSETMMLIREAFPGRARRWGVIIALWLAAAILSSFHWQMFYFGNNPYTWWQLFRAKAALWAVWGALTPMILWLAWRFRIQGKRALRNLILLSVAGVALTAVYMLLYTSVLWLNSVFVPPLRSVAFLPLFDWTIGVHSSWYFLAFWATVGIENAVIYYREYREREMRAAQLEAQLAVAQLSALRAQLQPHFLFNTLHSILALVREKDTETATRMLTSLSDLLRHALAHARDSEVSLRSELEFLRHYIGIEQVRFSDRLTVTWEIEDCTLDAAVPSFLLQPLAENAIRHGIEKRPGPGRIDVIARGDNGQVCLEIRDNGAGVQAEPIRDSARGHGVGGLRARLDAMYPGNYSLTIDSPNEGGTSVRLKLPWRTGAPVGASGD